MIYFITNYHETVHVTCNFKTVPHLSTCVTWLANLGGFEEVTVLLLKCVRNRHLRLCETLSVEGGFAQTVPVLWDDSSCYNKLTSTTLRAD